MTDLSSLSLQDAHQRLAEYSCIEHEAGVAPGDKRSLRQALLQVKAASDRQIFGVCADTLEEAKTALFSYLRGLDLPTMELKFEPGEGAVYLKFNPSTGRCYQDGYTGSHRGVLVSCQSDFADGINATYGHLPLDLFID